MTLLVADADRPTVAAALPPGVETVAAAEAPDAVEDGDHDLVVVATEAVVVPGDVVEAVRAAAPNAAVVGVGDVVVDADATAPADDEDAISDACERARRVAAYRDSVTDLYEACREHALGEDVDVWARRREADERLDEVPDEDALVAALRGPTDDG